MSRSTSRATPRGRAKVSGRPGPVDPSRASRGAVPPRSAGSGGPEWMTEQWKVQVEAEARRRLKKNMRHGASGG